MPFKVSNELWLKTETDRIQDIIIGIKYWHRAWTRESLQAELLEIGLEYSMPEIEELNDELHRRGDVEDIPED